MSRKNKKEGYYRLPDGVSNSGDTEFGFIRRVSDTPGREALARSGVDPFAFRAARDSIDVEQEIIYSEIYADRVERGLEEDKEWVRYFDTVQEMGFKADSKYIIALILLVICPPVGLWLSIKFLKFIKKKNAIHNEWISAFGEDFVPSNKVSYTSEASVKSVASAWVLIVCNSIGSIIWLGIVFLLFLFITGI